MAEEKDAQTDTGDEFNPPGPVARDKVISSHDDDDFSKPGPVNRDLIIKHGVPENPNKEKGA